MRTLIIGYKTRSNEYCLFELYSQSIEDLKNKNKIIEEKLNNSELIGSGQKINIVYTISYIPELFYNNINKILIKKINEWNKSDFVLLPTEVKILDNQVFKEIEEPSKEDLEFVLIGKN